MYLFIYLFELLIETRMDAKDKEDAAFNFTHWN